MTPFIVNVHAVVAWEAELHSPYSPKMFSSMIFPLLHTHQDPIWLMVMKILHVLTFIVTNMKGDLLFSVREVCQAQTRKYMTILLEMEFGNRVSYLFSFASNLFLNYFGPIGPIEGQGMNQLFLKNLLFDFVSN